MHPLLFKPLDFPRIKWKNLLSRTPFSLWDVYLNVITSPVLLVLSVLPPCVWFHSALAGGRCRVCHDPAASGNRSLYTAPMIQTVRRCSFTTLLPDLSHERARERENSVSLSSGRDAVTSFWVMEPVPWSSLYQRVRIINNLHMDNTYTIWICRSDHFSLAFTAEAQSSLAGILS